VEAVAIASCRNEKSRFVYYYKQSNSLIQGVTHFTNWRPKLQIL